MDLLPDRRPWRDARSFDDLRAMTLAFLTGERADFPGWGGRDADEETDALLPALEHLTAAGLVTVASQPGAPFGPGHDGTTWGTRAFVGGLVEDPARAEALARGARAHGLLARVESPAGPAPWAPVTVGLRDGVPYLVLGPGALEQELEIFRDAVPPGLGETLSGAALLWLVDPAWGRRDRLPAVARALADVSFAPPTAARGRP